MGHLAHNDQISVPTGGITVEDFTQSRIHKEIAASNRGPSPRATRSPSGSPARFSGALRPGRL